MEIEAVGAGRETALRNLYQVIRSNHGPSRKSPIDPLGSIEPLRPLNLTNGSATPVQLLKMQHQQCL